MRQFKGIIASALGLLVAASGCSTTSAPGHTPDTLFASPPAASVPSASPPATESPGPDPTPVESVGASAASHPILRASDIKPSAEVDLIFRKHHYEIEGNTAAQLFAQMNDLGPPDPGRPKHSFPGVTRTRFGWDVDESQPLGATRDRCMIESVDIYLDVWITLPRWEPPGSASQAVVAEWSRFLDRLRFHELGHKDIALRLAREAALAAKGLVGLCGVVSGTAEKRIAKILAGEEALHRSFDRSTRHGATQGAYLNLST